MATLITFPFEYANSKKTIDSLNGRQQQKQLPHSVSKSSLQEEFFQSNQWQTAMECLSLNLDEVMHIRYVLTKADLEALPDDCSLKEDVEKGKVRKLTGDKELVETLLPNFYCNFFFPADLFPLSENTIWSFWTLG